MTNYNFNRYKYFYILFETENNGYILKEEFLPPKFEEEQKQSKAFFALTEIVGEKLYNGYSEQKLLDEIGYISDYEISSNREEIKHTQGLCTVLGLCNSKCGKNTMYLIMTTKKIESFSQIPRYDASRHAIFLSSLRDQDGFEESAELYLN